SIADGETGYLVPPRDPETLADCLSRLLSDSKLRSRMGRAARQRIEDHYTWEHVATLAAATFSEVVREAAAPRVSRMA
ncbi:MAG TPA: glycosyltransferase, partial [Rubrobacteraceae bacterium]|nr:glycosyltransferase [Rubrobacteraceae bacterium]